MTKEEVFDWRTAAMMAFPENREFIWAVAGAALRCLGYRCAEEVEPPVSVSVEEVT